MTQIAELAAEQGMQATELDPGVWMLQGVDEWAQEQDEATLEQRLAAGRLQAGGF